MYTSEVGLDYHTTNLGIIIHFFRIRFRSLRSSSFCNILTSEIPKIDASWENLRVSSGEREDGESDVYLSSYSLTPIIIIIQSSLPVTNYNRLNTETY